MLFKVDLTDSKSCKDLMKKYGKNELPFAGHNENGEDVIICITPEKISVQTLQDNGWMRTNVLWANGTTEELYSR